MERLQGAVPNGQLPESPAGLIQANANIDADIIQQTLERGALPSATVEFNFRDVYQALSLAERKIVDGIQKQLEPQIPGGLQKLDPAEFTPEKTASRIVQGIGGLFPVFAEQNPDMDDAELVDAFMEAVNKGVDEGYEDAIEILEGLGAFEVEGVRDAVEETRGLIDEKLLTLENRLKKMLGVPVEEETDVESEVAGAVKKGLIAQAGAQGSLDLTV